MSRIAAHLDVSLEHCCHAIARITCNPAQPLCYVGEFNFCLDTENLKVQLAQYFEEAEIETVEFKE